MVQAIGWLVSSVAWWLYLYEHLHRAYRNSVWRLRQHKFCERGRWIRVAAIRSRRIDHWLFDGNSNQRWRRQLQHAQFAGSEYYGIQSDNRVLGLWSISRNYDSSQCVSWSWRVVIRSLGSQELPHRRTYESGIPSRGIQHSQPSQLLRERRESRCTQLRYRRTHPSAGEERWTRNASDRRQSR